MSTYARRSIDSLIDPHSKLTSAEALAALASFAESPLMIIVEEEVDRQSSRKQLPSLVALSVLYALPSGSAIAC